MIVSAVLLGRWRRLRNTFAPPSAHAARPAARRDGGGAGPRRAAATDRSEAVATLALGLVLMASSFAAISGLIGLSIEAGAGLDATTPVLAGMFTVVLAGLAVFDLNEGMGTLIADSDLDLLRRAPLGPGTLLAVKLLDALPRTSLLLVILALPATLAFFTNHPPAAWGWLLAPIQILALWCIPLGAGIAAALLVLRVVPARHVREGLGLVSTLTLLVVWLANSFLLPRLAEWPEASVGNVQALLGRVSDALADSPGGWLAAALRAAAESDPLGAMISTTKLVAAAALALALATWMAWLHLETVQGRIVVGAPARALHRATRRPASGPRPIVRAFLDRDARLMMRNWTVLADLLTTAALWTLLPIVVAPALEVPGPVVARTVLVALAVAVGTEVGTRTLPLERRGIVWSRLAPIAPVRWVAARATGAAILAGGLVLAATLGMASALDLGAAELLAVVAVVIPALAVALALGIWTGAAFGDPHWTNPRAMLALSGRVLSTGLLAGQALAWVLVSALVATLPRTAQWGVLGVLTAVASTLCVIALRLAARSLARAEG